MRSESLKGERAARVAGGEGSSLPPGSSWDTPRPAAGRSGRAFVAGGPAGRSVASESVSSCTVAARVP